MLIAGPSHRAVDRKPVPALFYSNIEILAPRRAASPISWKRGRDSLNPIATLPAILAIEGLFVLALYLARKHRLVSFRILWYPINLVIESSVIGLEIIFEHGNYLSSMFLILMASCCCIDCCGRTGCARESWALRLEPDNAGAQNNLGVALAIQGSFDAALKHFDEALRISPDNAEAYGNRANALASLGRYKEAFKIFTPRWRLIPPMNRCAATWIKH